MSLLSRVRGFWKRGQLDRDIEAELRSHAEMRAGDNLRAGMSAREARDDAQRRFGSSALLKEETRRMDLIQWLESLARDIRFGTRMLSRSPGVTALAVLSLALGIGANTAIFSLLDPLVLRLLPVEDPKALVIFGSGHASGNSDGIQDGSIDLFSYSTYREMQRKNQVFSGVAAFDSSGRSVHGTVARSSNLEPINVQLVSGTYFDVLGVKSVAGRELTDADDQTLGAHPVAVASYAWWTSRFSRDPAAVGTTITIGPTVYTIVGVMAPGFFGTSVGQLPDLWIPLQMADNISRGPHKLNDKLYNFLDIIARLKPGLSSKLAGADANVVFKNTLYAVATTQEDRDTVGKAYIELTSLATGISSLRRGFEDPLWMLTAAVGLVLLIACANIANLLLARGTARHREIAVRLALGAGRARLVRQLMTESVLLSILGASLGVVFASWASHFLLQMVSGGPKALPLDVSLDSRVLAFTIAVSLLSAAFFGVVPAFRATRVEMTASLKESRGGVSGRGRNPIAKALVVAQVALSLVLLIGAGLMVRSLINYANVDPGFHKDGVLLLVIDPTTTGFTDHSQLLNLYRQIEERVDAIPGVSASSYSIFTYNTGAWSGDAWPKNVAASSSSGLNSSYNAIGQGYFDTMGLRVLDGRNLNLQDTPTSPRVAVINETMARGLFPGASAIGKRFGMDGPEPGKDIEVVGVVQDSKYLRLDEKPQPMAYYPYTQYVPGWGIGLYLWRFEARFRGAPKAVTAEIRHAVEDVNPNMPITSVQTLAERVDGSITIQRLVAQLSTFFGAVALFLACIGIYGLTSYAVSRRTNEIGLRMALGARRWDVLRMVMRENLLLVVIGLALGVPAALAGDRWIAHLLYGLKPTDPVTLVASVALLLAVAAFAGFIPARRALKVDPMVALRYE